MKTHTEKEKIEITAEAALEEIFAKMDHVEAVCDSKTPANTSEDKSSSLK